MTEQPTVSWDLGQSPQEPAWDEATEAYASVGTGWLTGVQVVIADAAKAASAYAAAKQAISLDEGAAAQMLKDTRGLQDNIRELYDQARRTERLNPPADEEASSAYNRQLTWDGGTPGAFAFGAGHLRVQWNYLSALAAALEKALGITVDSDATLAGQIKDVAESEGGMAG